MTPDAALQLAASRKHLAYARSIAGIGIHDVAAREAYQAAFQGLRKGGVLLVVGIPAKPLSWMAGDLIRSGIRIVPSRVASRAELQELMRLAAAGSIHSEVGTFPLEEINAVMERLAAGQIFGRSVISM